PPSPDYIPGPEAPPSPDYIPGPEAQSSPDYIPRPEYPEYLPPADDVLPAKEQPLPAAVSLTAESSGYITKSEPEMEPEEEDGDDEKSEEDSIEYPTSGGDDDADDDGDNLSEDDADDEEDEESSDSEEEEEEHLAPTVPNPALHSSIPAFEDSNEIEPFEEGETAATPPPFRYRVVVRISVQPHILMPFRSESEVKRLLAIPTSPLSPVSPTSYPLPPFLMPLPIFTPLPTSSFLLPLSLPSTFSSESILEADIPLRKRDRFTTPTGGYEKIAPKRTTRSTQVPTVTLAPTATTTTVTEAQLQALINQGVVVAMTEAEASRVRNGYGSNESDRVEKYIGGLTDTIHDSVKATKPKTMHEAIEIATELMDKRIRDAVENKQKFEGTSGNNQNQPQQNKRHNTGQAYAAGNSDRNMYTWSKPLCSKCDYHHDGSYPPRCNNCKRVGHLTRDCRSRPANAN
nr:hypothetical protein [Tanacetum cinerariifolium]